MESQNEGMGFISYLRVEQSVGVVPVGRSLVQPVVAPSRVVHVHVRSAQRESHGQTRQAQDACHLVAIAQR